MRRTSSSERNKQQGTTGSKRTGRRKDLNLIGPRAAALSFKYMANEQHSIMDSNGTSGIQVSIDSTALDRLTEHASGADGDVK